ncbi:MAG TPA: exopolysaccharide biosynthesis polyprenyl glycosylphosphotransferase [Candidatus Saccharimonadales bacterium]|nr:exopolysaccharide biosynthesis polyprenyl glycosylphosphotransferase [Candidatus Saccharimonadales bacterium]
MKNNTSLIYGVCLVVGDFLALVAAFIAAYFLRVHLGLRLNPHRLGVVHAATYIEVFLSLLPFWILIFGLLGLYNSNTYENRFKEAGRLLVGSFVGMLFVVFWDFAAAKPIFPARLIPIYGFGLGFLFLLIFRNIARLIRTQLFSYNVGLTNVLLVGSTQMTTELINLLHDSKHSGYRIIGVVGSKQFVPGSHIPVFRTFRQFLGSDLPSSLHRIIQTELYTNEGSNAEILSYAQENHAAYRFVPGNTELFVGNIEVELLKSEIPVIAVHQTALFGWGRIVKRLSDLILGSIMFIVAAPFMLLIATAIKISDPHAPVLFRQTRLTRFDQKFTAYKFRTVRADLNGLDPEEAFKKLGRPELIETYRKNADYIPNDPRFSRFSLILRRLSLDELPQVFNLLKGDISLVGPRALIPRELAVYKKRSAILSVKSGMTSLAVVLRRSDMSFEERRKLDLYYVQNWSIWLDFVILIKTAWVVVTSRGAR